MTVKDLREFLKEYADSTPIFVENIQWLDSEYPHNNIDTPQSLTSSMFTLEIDKLFIG